MGLSNLETLKRNQICSILSDKNWDYKSPDKLSSMFSLCLHELFVWFSRKGSRLSPIVLQTVCESLCAKHLLSHTETMEVCNAVSKFVTLPLYSRLTAPITNYPGKLGIGKMESIYYELPVMDESETTLSAILNKDWIQSEEDLMNSYEVKFMAVWLFVVKNRYPDFYNIEYNAGSPKVIHFKPDEKYIRKAKKFINNMNKLFYSYSYIAPPEICTGCSRRSECPQFTKIKD